MARLILKSPVFTNGSVQILWHELPVTIGRSIRADIRVSDRLLSRIHSEIRPGACGGFDIVDCNSTNLTIVNDCEVDRVALKSGDVILLGDTELIVEIETPKLDLLERTTREIQKINSRDDSGSR